MTSVTKHSWMVNHMLCIILCLALVAVSSFITNHPAPRRASCFMINLQQIPSLTIECIFLHLLSLICGTEHYKSGRGFKFQNEHILPLILYCSFVPFERGRPSTTQEGQNNNVSTKYFESTGKGRTITDISIITTTNQVNQLDVFKSEDHALLLKAHFGYKKKKGTSFK